MHTALFRAFSKRFTRPKFLPAEHHNYNLEHYAGYTRRYRSALDQKKLLIEKLDPNRPKTKRTPKTIKEVNTSLKNYQAWRDFTVGDLEESITGFQPRIVAKLVTTPKKLVAAFGPWTPAIGSLPRATASLKFVDRNMDSFSISDAQTVKATPEVRTNPKAELDRARNFWSTDKEHEFWITATRDAEVLRFKRFLKRQLDLVEKGELPTFHDRMIDKVGEENLYLDFEKDYSELAQPMPLVYKVHRTDLEIDGKTNLEFPEDSEYDQRWVRPPKLEDHEDAIPF
jgi:hypothetical protein